MTSPTHWIYRGLIYTSLVRTSDQLYSHLIQSEPMPPGVMVLYFLTSLGIFEPLRENGEPQQSHYYPKNYVWRFFAMRILRYFLTISLMQGGLQLFADPLWQSGVRLLPHCQHRFSVVSLIFWTIWVAFIGEYVHRLLTQPPQLIQSQIQSI